MAMTLGKRRRLQQAASVAGTFTVLAIDHRGPLRRRLAKEPGAGDVDQALARLKQDIVRTLAPSASAVLLDPELGLGACVESGALPGATGLLVALDTGSTGDPAILQTGLVADWDVARVLRAGAAGVKLLVYYHPRAPQSAQVEQLVHEIGNACARAQVPLFLEPLSFWPEHPERSLPSPQRRQVVIETARRLTPLGVDVLKAEFPVNPADEPDASVWRAACAELTAACPVPWVLLSAGVDFETFLRQTTIACAAGASGVIAGRAVWNEAVTLDLVARHQFLLGPARERLRRLRAVCDAQARPFS